MVTDCVHVCHLQSRFLDLVSRVRVATVLLLYLTLRGEETQQAQVELGEPDSSPVPSACCTGSLPGDVSRPSAGRSSIAGVVLEFGLAPTAASL